ncbi:hypothetical protein ACHAW6_011605 [Cyclotella cf. meneghiniana]
MMCRRGCMQNPQDSTSPTWNACSRCYVRNAGHSFLSMSSTDPIFETPTSIAGAIYSTALNPKGEERVQAAISQFVSTIRSSLDNQTFISFTLKGPSAPRLRKNLNVDGKEQLNRQKEKLRGKYKSITGRLILLNNQKKRNKSVDNNTDGVLFLQANIKYHLATDMAQNWKVGRDASTCDEVENGLNKIFSSAIGIHSDEDLLSEWGAPQYEHMNGELGLFSGEIVTAKGTYKLILHPTHKACFSSPKEIITLSKTSDATAMNVLAHDKQKNVPLSPSSLFFQKLGVTDSKGKPVHGMSSKLRQCQKFVEIVGKLIDESVVASLRDSLNHPKEDIVHPTAVRVIDMGCGRGYLTFSLHSYLCSKYLSSASPKIDSVQTQGIDRRPKLIQEINDIAHDLGGEFNSLNFIEGTIEGAQTNLFQNKELPQNGDSIVGSETVDDSTIDILIALHACDTATDDAIWFAIARKADIIVTAPCCQHELRSQIDHHAASFRSHDISPLNEVLRHAIYRERHTEIITDAMRALLLEIAGYETQVFEFVGGEHTAKNVMITAVKRNNKGDSSGRQLEDKRTRLVELAKMYGIKRQLMHYKRPTAYQKVSFWGIAYTVDFPREGSLKLTSNVIIYGTLDVITDLGISK